MVQATSCPDAPALQRFLLGQTGAEESAPLEAHLLHCDHCLRAVRTLPADDPLISALQQGRASATPAPRSELLEKLRLRLQDMGPSARGTDTSTGENTAAQAPAFEATENGSLSLAPPQQPDEIGRLGGYRVLKELGRGGMGVVYQAEDLKLKRLVALKVMLPRLAADAGARQRFLREAQAMAAVHHDHVAVIFQVDEDRGVPFLAMEFLQGTPLDQWLKAGRKPSIAQVLRLGREIAEGLAAAHERGLIHRDVKPGNIWLDSSHKGRVKILDFGLARAGTEDVHLTRTGTIVGTPAYMAPEQAQAEKVDARSDLFSLGCVLYRLCTGAMPFAGDNVMALLRALVLDNPRPVRELNPDVPSELSDLVMKLLEKDPARRPASAREVIRAIQTLETHPARKQDADDRTEAVAAAPRPAAAPRTAPRRRRLALAVAALVVLGGVVAVGAAALVRIQTPQGDYVIDTDDPDFFFQVHDGAVNLQDRKNNKTYTLVVKQDKGAGEFDLEVADGGDLSFKTKTFTIKRGERAVLTAWFEPKGVAVNPQPAKLDDAWLKQVAALPAEKQVEAVAAELKARNPGFDGKVTPKIESGVVTELQFVTVNVTDISPVRALTGLKTLECGGNPTEGYGKLSDLSPLKGMKLTRLWCHCTQVSDLSPLKGVPLTSLTCYYTQVSDLSPLKGMKLTELSCSGTAVSDLSPLKDMKLTYLDCASTPVSDLSPLKSMKLTFLNCDATLVSDLSPLKGMPLKVLRLDFKPERDADILRSITTLETINGKPAKEFWKDVEAKSLPPLDKAWVEKVRALPPEKQAAEVAAELKRRNPGFDGKVTAPWVVNGAVTYLRFLADDVTDISPVRALPGLGSLECVGTVEGKGRLSDLSPLKDVKLTELDIGSTAVSDLSPLKDMKLTRLRCGYTGVTDLSLLKGMPLTELSCEGAKVTDLSPLKNLPLKQLSCDFKPARDADILRSIKTLETINGKPAAEFWKDVAAAARPPLDDAWVKQVAALSAEKQVQEVVAKLKELNPGFDGQVKPTEVEDGAAAGLEVVTDDVTDISPVRALPQLKRLICKGSARGKGRLTDLSSLKDMKLTTLVWLNTPGADLSPLRGMPLTQLNCGDTRVSDLSPLRGMPLTNLSLWNTPVEDLSPLKDMKLDSLDFTGTRVKDLSPLKGLPLLYLCCHDTPVSDLSPLKGMRLVSLDCKGAPVSDLSPLKGMPLKAISCDFKPERDAEILRSFGALEQINGKPAADFWKEVDEKKPEKKP